MKHTMVRYSRLSTDVQVDTVPPSQVTRCPKLTRYKLVTVTAILMVAFLLVVASSLTSGHLNLVLNKPGPACAFSERINHSSTDSNFKMSMWTDASHSHRHHHGEYKSRFPRAIIIGARKAGTRALLKFLRLHPDVATAKRETHYFDRYSSRSLEWYLSQMPPSFEDQITVEKTPSYFVDWDVPARVYQFNSSIKLLLIVRNPIDRLVSDYLQLEEKMRKIEGSTYATFEDMVLRSGQIDKSYAPVKRSLYNRHLEKWLALFPRRQILVVDGDNIKVRPWEEMARVETFLGLSHKIYKECFVYNASKGFYCLRVRNWNVTIEASQGDPSRLWTLSCLSESKGREHPAIDPDVRQKLKEFFAPFNKRFFHRIGQTFSWS